MSSFAAYKRKIEAKELELKRLYEELEKKDKAILREGHEKNWDKIVESEKLATGKLEEEVENLTEEEEKKILGQEEHQKKIQESLPKGEAMGLDYEEPEEISEEEDRQILREGSPQHRLNFERMEEVETKHQGALIESEQRDLSGETEIDEEILGHHTIKTEEEETKESWQESEGKLFSYDFQDLDEWTEGVENKDNMLISGSIISVGEKSKNGKTYPLEACRESAKDLQERLQAGEIIPLLDGHPASEKDSSTEQVIGKIKSVEFDEDEIGFVGEISSTERGKDCQTLIRDNCVEGLSLGAIGDFDKESGIVKSFNLEHLALTWKPSSSAKIKSILN